MRTVVDEFAEALNAPPVVHLVKFDDPLIRADFARWAEEIYALEMKLRRVLTLVYLHAYQDGSPYELLREEKEQPMNKEQSKPDYMKIQAENEFFHLTFGQYVGLNSRPEFKLAQLLGLIRSKEEYDHLRQEVTRAPVEDEDDAVLLAGLKERMDAIEDMRNCCAHSRRPSKKAIQNYDNVSPLLHQLLDDYLARWEPVEEMPWDQAARGGADILAGAGPLGFGSPRLCVEVKSQSSPIDRPTVDKLLGAVQKFGADEGLFVSWSGFKNNVQKELAASFFKVRLWSQMELLEQLFANYDRFDDDLKAEFPLKRIWTVAAQEED